MSTHVMYIDNYSHSMCKYCNKSPDGIRNICKKHTKPVALRRRRCVSYLHHPEASCFCRTTLIWFISLHILSCFYFWKCNLANFEEQLRGSTCSFGVFVRVNWSDYLKDWKHGGKRRLGSKQCYLVST